MPAQTTSDHPAGRALQELRDEAGMTQEQLADELGCTQGTISKWEAHGYHPDNAVELEKHFGLPLGDLVRLTDKYRGSMPSSTGPGYLTRALADPQQPALAHVAAA